MTAMLTKIAKGLIVALVLGSVSAPFIATAYAAPSHVTISPAEKAWMDRASRPSTGGGS
jgi:hypothetical protein